MLKLKVTLIVENEYLQAQGNLCILASTLSLVSTLALAEIVTYKDTCLACSDQHPNPTLFRLHHSPT